MTTDTAITSPEPTARNLTVAWGITPHGNATAAWGARAIMSANRNAYEANHTKRGPAKKKIVVPYFNVELLYDRQGAAGHNGDLQLLQKWLDGKGMPWIRSVIATGSMGPEEDRAIELTDNTSGRRFTIHANPRASHGYLYVGAWIS